MKAQSLAQFICVNREEILRRCREKVSARSPSSTPDDGIPLFLDDIVWELGGGLSKVREMSAKATRHGSSLFSEGFTVAQVVHDYGDVCQSVTDLAVHLGVGISAEDFRILNRCLDDAIASAVSEYSRLDLSGENRNPVTDFMDFRNLVESAIAGFELLQEGTVGVGGTTGALVHRCLLAMRTTINDAPTMGNAQSGYAIPGVRRV